MKAVERSQEEEEAAGPESEKEAEEAAPCEADLIAQAQDPSTLAEGEVVTANSEAVVDPVPGTPCILHVSMHPLTPSAFGAIIPPPTKGKDGGTSTLATFAGFSSSSKSPS